MKRFGRNQRRKMRERIKELEMEVWGADLAQQAIGIMRDTCSAGLGFDCTFVDDDMRVLVGLSQRAVLAGLNADMQTDMQLRMGKASEPFRNAHERALGFPLLKRTCLPEQQT